MSLSKELCLRSDSQNSDSFSDCLVNKFESKEDNYRRDSFCDRFCDDLCEEILQYLSLEDKLRIQCVSKQFQRTVFKRQYELYIRAKNSNDSKYDRNLSIRDKKDYYYYIENQNFDSFEALLKKCPNITSLELDAHDLSYSEYNSDKINEVFRLIIENCNNMNEFIAFNDMNESNYKEFQRKFGPKIKHLGCPANFINLIESGLFPNIEKIYFHLIEDSIIGQLKLDKLKQLELEINEGQENMLQTFIDTFPTLTHLKVLIFSDDENAIYKSVKNISNLKHLIQFEFIAGYGLSNNRLNGLLKQMANNCRNLKRIDCCFTIDQNSDIKELLSQLKAFPALKRLNLWFRFYNYEVDVNIDVNQLFSFELFKGFENITHLSLGFGSTQTLKESILREIDINLPKLQYLQITNTFETTPEGVIQMADILNRLSRLQTINLGLRDKVDLKPIKKQFTQKWRKIKKIQIYSGIL